MSPSPKATILSMLSSTGRCSIPQPSSKTHLAFCLLKQTHEALLGSEDGVAGSQAAHVVVHSIQLPPLQKNTTRLRAATPGAPRARLPSLSLNPAWDRQTQSERPFPTMKKRCF